MKKRLHTMMMDAAREVGCASYTTVDEIEEELVRNPEWLTTYALEEIKLRDVVIRRLIGKAHP